MHPEHIHSRLELKARDLIGALVPSHVMRRLPLPPQHEHDRAAYEMPYARNSRPEVGEVAEYLAWVEGLPCL